jgi:hypothetical protein
MIENEVEKTAGFLTQLGDIPSFNLLDCGRGDSLSGKMDHNRFGRQGFGYRLPEVGKIPE